MTDPTKAYGFTALPRDSTALLPPGKSNNAAPTPAPVSTTPIPSTPLAARIQAYAKAHLNPKTYNHSMRVYHYGIAIAKQQFRDWEWTTETEETYFLSCLLHDIGTTESNLRKTRMSFEFYGGMVAMDVLQGVGEEGKGVAGDHLVAPKVQAESVAEAIFRHQDIGTTGKITTVGLLIHLATIFDNMGGHADLVHHGTIEDVTTHFPRNKWSSCFAATIREENGLKPWAHTTALGEEDFPNGVLGNKLMAPFD